MKKNLFALTCVVCALLALVACAIASFDDGRGAHSLQFTASFVEVLSAYGQGFSVAGQRWFLYVCVAVVGFLGAASLGLKEKGGRLFVLGTILALIAQLILVDRLMWEELFPPRIASLESMLTIPLGLVLYALAAVVLVVAIRRRSEPPVFNQGIQEDGRFELWDCFVLGLLFCAALLLRVYAINHVVNYFDGELSPYAAGATSLRGMFFANRGFYGPWAPLGLLYYLPIYFTTSIWGADLTSLRLSSALVGLATIPMVYLLGARLAGRTGGHIAAALFAFNVLHIGWSRTDIHPHGVTTWPTVLMCYFLLKAFDTRKLSYSLGVAIMMGVSWHQYPSGQSAVSIPLLAVGLYWIQNRGRLALRGWQLCVLLLGIVLWALGLPLSYYPTNGDFVVGNPFNLTGPRALWGGDQSTKTSIEVALLVLSNAWVHLGDVVQGLFYRVPYLFHQEWVPYQSGIHHRTMPWMEMSFVVVGLLILLGNRKRFESCVLLAWLAAAILPGILSERAYPKRLSTFFPGLDVVAAIALASILSTLSPYAGNWRRYLGKGAIVAILAGYFCFLNHVWFSGRFWRYGEPPEVQVARDISASLPPKTLVFSFFGGGFEQGKYIYLLLDHFTRPEKRPNLLLLIHQNDLPDLLRDPNSYRQRMLSIWPYVWTKLRDQVRETMEFQEWERVVFLFLHVDAYGRIVDDLVAQAVAGCAHPITSTIEPPARADSGNAPRMTRVECRIEDLISRSLSPRQNSAQQ